VTIHKKKIRVDLWEFAKGGEEGGQGKLHRHSWWKGSKMDTVRTLLGNILGGRGTKCSVGLKEMGGKEASKAAWGS